MGSSVETAINHSFIRIALWVKDKGNKLKINKLYLLLALWTSYFDITISLTPGSLFPFYASVSK